MSEPTAQQNLTPQFCFSSTALRDFLRISRGTIDDSINQNLNALITPAAAGFDPHSTSQRISRPTAHRRIDPGACQTFKDQVLFSSWQARSDVLSYCALVATSPDPADPEAAVREAEMERNRERVVDERLDPYSGRFFPTEPRTSQLAMLIRMEQGVENIVRARTWGLVRERCGDSAEDWQTALAGWRRENGAKGRDGV
ncbi:hypothetical protein N0V82_010637 [Gnomoniopsis sp. IMI 355080]|nr:hypothetical protein N0V82_010637 [Gnomoniopsis sp. IMI 355080]